MEKIKQALERARSEQGVNPRAKRNNSNRHQKSSLEKIEYNQTRVYSPDAAQLKKHQVVIGSPEFEEAETSFKILRTQVEQRLAGKGWNALAVSSPSAGDGKTTIAINLAIALAQEMHRTVLLVDLDFRNPNVHIRFDCEIHRGLVDYLLEDVPISDILVNPGIDRLVLLPAGAPTSSNTSELLSSPKMISLVDELKTRYPARIIIFDLPPLLSSDDALAFSPFVDTTLLVVSEGHTTKNELQRVVEYMGNNDILGTVLNRATEAQKTYYKKPALS